ncbi:hypothetical protein HK103_006103 [Boothiomyces macroporosus]|uniref:Uncharacterized protein n=1 Tax=Boothiomyces macroporosus TaxID=261099 RepID=A0AAD5UHE9_9FUNG|nr:hypothetical protein HK103_006103 [Boothiomyces macroporosus]
MLDALQLILIPSIGFFHALAIHFGLRRKGERVEIPIDFITTQLDSVKSKPKPKEKVVKQERTVFKDIEQFYGIEHRPRQRNDDKTILDVKPTLDTSIPTTSDNPIVAVPPNIHRMLRLSSKPSRIQSKYLSPSDSDSEDDFGTPIKTDFLQI